MALILTAACLWFAVARPDYASGSRNAINGQALQVSPDTLRKHVVYLSEVIGSRSYRERESLNAAANYIHTEFEALTTRVSEQVFIVDGLEYRNIIAEFGPPSGDVIVVGAHYDTYQNLPGADDNASGIAGVIELARLLSQQPPSKRMMLVGFSLEEPPFFGSDAMGSARFATMLKAENVEVEIMVSLEMIGYFSDEAGSQRYPWELMSLVYPDTGDSIFIVDHLFSGVAAKLKKAMRGHTGVPVHSINAPWYLDGIAFSDHRNFWVEGYPAVMVTDTAFLRNLNYHTPEDTAEKLDYDRMAHVVQGVWKGLEHW